MPLPPDAGAVAGGLDTPTIASALTLIAVTIKGVLDHRKGQTRDDSGSEQLTQIHRSIGEIRADVGKLGDDMRDLTAHVIGPDGQNGLRGDVRELKEDVRGILEREREAGPRHLGLYDRRSAP